MWLHSSPAAPSPPSQLEFIGHKFTAPRLRFLGFIWSCSYNFKFPARIFPVVKYSFCDLWPLFSLTSLSCCWWRIMKLILFTKAPNVWCVCLITHRWKQPDTFKLSSNRTAAVCVAVCSVDISDKLITLIITNTHNKHECVFFLHFMLKPNADIKQRSSAL